MKRYTPPRFFPQRKPSTRKRSWQRANWWISATSYGNNWVNLVQWADQSLCYIPHRIFSTIPLLALFYCLPIQSWHIGRPAPMYHRVLFPTPLVAWWQSRKAVFPEIIWRDTSRATLTNTLSLRFQEIFLSDCGISMWYHNLREINDIHLAAVKFNRKFPSIDGITCKHFVLMVLLKLHFNFCTMKYVTVPHRIYYLNFFPVLSWTFLLIEISLFLSHFPADRKWEIYPKEELHSKYKLGSYERYYQH